MTSKKVDEDIISRTINGWIDHGDVLVWRDAPLSSLSPRSPVQQRRSFIWRERHLRTPPFALGLQPWRKGALRLHRPSQDAQGHVGRAQEPRHQGEAEKEAGEGAEPRGQNNQVLIIHHVYQISLVPFSVREAEARTRAQEEAGGVDPGGHQRGDHQPGEEAVPAEGGENSAVPQFEKGHCRTGALRARCA